MSKKSHYQLNLRQLINSFNFFIIFLQLISNFNLIYGSEFDQKVDYISAPYREIKNMSCISRDASFICDCNNVKDSLFLPPLDGNVYKVIVRNCDTLTVGSNLLESVQGFTLVTFQNINELILQKDSLLFKPTGDPQKLIFERINSIEINSHAINGRIENITFKSSGIATIQQYGITTKAQYGILTFDDIFVDKINQDAFKRFSIETLVIKNTIMTSSLPYQSFHDVKVQQVLIQNVTFKEVSLNAFHFDEINKLEIRDNKFLKTSPEWISAGMKSSILIENNNFGETSPKAFEGLKQHRDYTKSVKIDMRFNENTIYQSPTPYNEEVLPLTFDNRFNLMIRNLTYLNKFPCHIKHELKPDSFYKIFADTIYFISTEKSNSNSQLQPVRKILETECEEVSYLAYIIGGSILIIALLIAIFIATICYVIKKKEKQKLEVNPEPITYEETQLVFKIEKAGVLKTDL